MHRRACAARHLHRRGGARARFARGRRPGSSACGDGPGRTCLPGLPCTRGILQDPFCGIGHHLAGLGARHRLGAGHGKARPALCDALSRTAKRLRRLFALPLRACHERRLFGRAARYGLSRRRVFGRGCRHRRRLVCPAAPLLSSHRKSARAHPAHGGRPLRHARHAHFSRSIGGARRHDHLHVRAPRDHRARFQHRPRDFGFGAHVESERAIHGGRRARALCRAGRRRRSETVSDHGVHDAHIRRDHGFDLRPRALDLHQPRLGELCQPHRRLH